MLNDDGGMRPCPGNDRGTWLATPASLESSADPGASAFAPESKLSSVPFRGAAVEVFKRIEPDPNPVDLTDDYAEEVQAIEDEFRRRLFGLRRLPRRDRAQALKAAKDFRSLALRALREQRVRDRSMTLLFRQLRAPEPR